MPTIGFRAEPSALNWAIVEGTQKSPALIAADTLKAPISFDDAASLAWFHDQTLHLFNQYSPTAAAIRYPEMMPERSNQASANKRCRVEGVVMEAVQSKGISVSTGALGTISKNLGTKGAKRYLGQNEWRGLNWAEYSKNRREAILVAVSVLPES
jgi:Holliday junction resolvasome RuvABC endonuclease subunit